jgi:hypothetical protein
LQNTAARLTPDSLIHDSAKTGIDQVGMSISPCAQALERFFDLCSGVSELSKSVPALGGCEAVEELAAVFPAACHAAFLGTADEPFELREHQLSTRTACPTIFQLQGYISRKSRNMAECSRLKCITWNAGRLADYVLEKLNDSLHCFLGVDRNRSLHGSRGRCAARLRCGSTGEAAGSDA